MNGGNGIQLFFLVLLTLLAANLLSEEWSSQLDQMDQILIGRYFSPGTMARIEKEVIRQVTDISPIKGADHADSFVSDRTTPPVSSPEFRLISEWLEVRVQLFEKTVKRMLRRLWVILEFARLGLLLTLLFVVDGLLKWKVRRTNFAYSSPLTHRLTILAFGSLICLFPLALITPLPFLPAMIPFLWFTMGWTMQAHIAHLPKRL